MDKLKKILRFFVDIVEVYLPIFVFVTLLLAFLMNVFFRYVLKNPLNWTFELSINAFVIIGLLGACTAHRTEDHVVFDLLYSRVNQKWKNILRILSSALIIVFFLMVIPGSIEYLVNLRSVTSIMKIPLGIIFFSFPILLISTVLRSIYRLINDIKTLKNKSYVQSYNNTEDKELLI